MLDVNVVGVFMTAQAAAKMMIKYNSGKGGSICLIASMSATIANRVSNTDARSCAIYCYYCLFVFYLL